MCCNKITPLIHMEAEEPQIPAVAASLTATLLLALYLSARLMTSSLLLLSPPSLQSSFSFQSGALGLVGWSGIILYLFTRDIRSVTQSDPGHHNSFVTNQCVSTSFLAFIQQIDRLVKLL